MIDFLTPEKAGGDFKKLLDDVRGGKPTTAFSLAPGAKAYLAAAIKSVVLYVTADRLSAEDAFRRIKGYDDDAVLLAAKDDLLIHRVAYSGENTAQRTDALTKLVTGRAKTVVLPAEALLQYLPNAETFKDRIIELKTGCEYDYSAFPQLLSSMGYSRSEAVFEKGGFCVRGDIIDIFPPSFGRMLRVSFFDTEIESIRLVSPDGDESEEISEVVVPPASDILLGEKESERVAAKLAALKVDGRLKEIADDVREKLSLNPNDSTLLWALPFMENLSTVFDYLPPSATVVFDEPKILSDKLDLIEKEHYSRVKSLCEGNSALPVHKNSLIKKSYAVARSKLYNRLAFQQITSMNPLFEASAQYSFRSRALTKYYLDHDALIADLKNFIYNDYKVVLCCSNGSRARTVAENLMENGVMTHVTNGLSAGVSATEYNIPTGFIYHDAKIAVIGTEELFGKGRSDASAVRKKRNIPQIKSGDYVVHSVHGVGYCEGTEKLAAAGVEKDYVVLRYRDGDKLYVPIDQMDLLTKFSGGETPRLNKIGGKEFAKIKAKAKQSIKKLAIDLLELYSAREKQKGFVYSPDTVWQKEFEDNFEFELTDDQAAAVADIKADMEKGKVADRLICGDVGYGKTEVAFRAVFKTVMDNKQAAILAPTTILAKQHYNTLCARLSGFGIKVALMSRIQSNSEIEAALEGLKSGVISIVVATHRLLSKDVVFHDLGLLVLDEEQRFGVEHKEKIKNMKRDVNVLTLTATPIPRTLNLALSGVRDISLLETPPKNRLPVQNYVTEYSDALLKDAVLREVARGGQVFVLYNYVETIEAFADKIRSLTDGKVSIIVAHGQMSAGELDAKTTAFYQHEADVLIATTIIENGIDLPDANTLFVYDADRFGLAQLYQLRGRVGRSGVLAHAYFTTRQNKVLTSQAGQRLTALTEYAEFGSGFKISLRDLEIRGAGSFLGAEQHGHIEKIGYDLYSQMLRETVNEIKSGITDDKREIEIKIDCNAYISDDYVSAADKIRVYKRISEVSNARERDELLKSLEDIYGKPAQPLVNLIDIALIKSMAARYKITKIVADRRGAGFVFESADVFASEGLLGAVTAMDKEVVLTAAIPPTLLFDARGKTVEETLKTMIKFLETADKN